MRYPLTLTSSFLSHAHSPSLILSHILTDSLSLSASHTYPFTANILDLYKFSAVNIANKTLSLQDTSDNKYPIRSRHPRRVTVTSSLFQVDILLWSN